MADYKSMYTRLFNAATDAISLLQQAQIETEEAYISQEEPRITLLRSDADGGDNADSEDTPDQ